MFVAASPPEVKQAIVARAADLPASIGTRLFPRMVAWDAQHMEAALMALRVPLLVIQSTHLNAHRVRVSLEPGVDTPWLQTVRRCVPGARVEVVSGVGHFPQVEAPERINRLIETFVRRL
jgi:pimeloyl-ACP methyl ester carboxylesterase